MFTPTTGYEMHFSLKERNVKKYGKMGDGKWEKRGCVYEQSLFFFTYRIFSKEPHLAGTQRNNDLADFMVAEWKTFDFDRVEAKEYDVLLSYPRNPANVSLYDEDGRHMYQLTMVEEPFFEEENSTHSVYPFNGYTASGDVEVSKLLCYLSPYFFIRIPTLKMLHNDIYFSLKLLTW